MDTTRTPNALIHESSPYLQQHAYNPVRWLPWSEAALELAQKENKLILVSVGYSACHWCHVMERECFEDEQIAQIMNAHFVCIKVDREERPDVDQVYMDAVQLMSGRGGWPLNCFALPDGKPVYGGTYFPAEQWVRILQTLAQQWREQPEKAREYADRLTAAIQEMESGAEEDIELPKDFSEDMARIWIQWHQRMDLTNGGEERAPKFPMPVNWTYLLRYGHHSGNQACLDHVHFTLKKMAWGGIYDAVGGGFARYSVDGHWHIPHFEKMLYDNGQLVQLYAEAWQQKPDPLYLQVISETLEWMAREMTTPEGGFHSALDADSEGEEGKFYVWTLAETRQVLGDKSPLWEVAYNFTQAGNWEHGNNNPIKLLSDEALADKFGITAAQVAQELDACKTLLLAARSQRVRPGLDDKVLTSWNAMMLKGYVMAYRITGREDWLEAALQNARFLETALLVDGKLMRSWKNGTAQFMAYAEDYALLIDAYLALYQATFDTHWLQRSHQLLEVALSDYWDAGANLFWYTSKNAPALIARKKELYDNVIPSSNALMAHNLRSLGHLLGKADWVKQASSMLSKVYPQMVKHTGAHACWAALMLRHAWQEYEVAILGPQAHALRMQLDQHYVPNALLAGSTQQESSVESNLEILENRWPAEGKTLAYPCQGSACQLPTAEVEKLLQTLRK